MKTIILLASAVVAGAVRYPIEGPLTVRDEEADNLIENGSAELAEGLEDEDDGDGLDKIRVDDLKAIAKSEEIDLGDATRKADIIAAIRLHREAQLQLLRSDQPSLAPHRSSQGDQS